MTEQVPAPGPQDSTEQHAEDTEADPAYGAGADAPTPTGTPTGVPAVDRVLTGLDELDDLPLEAHLAAFDKAHSALRSALDAEPGEPG